MNKILYPVVISFLATPLWADATLDAKYIVEQTVNEAVFKGALIALKPVILSAMENDLRAQGIEINDLTTFGDILFEEFLGEFVENMQSATIEYYIEQFSPENLESIARFYASEPGQAMLEQTPGLMAFGAQQGARIGEIAGRNAGPRVAARLETEGVTITKDKGMLQKLIDALR